VPQADVHVEPSRAQVLPRQGLVGRVLLRRRARPRAIRHDGEQEPERRFLFVDRLAQRLQAADQPTRVEVVDRGRVPGLDGADRLQEGPVRAVAVAGGHSLGDVLGPSAGQHPADQFTKALLVGGIEWSAGHERAILSVGQATADHPYALDASGLARGGRGDPRRHTAALRIEGRPVGR